MGVLGRLLAVFRQVRHRFARRDLEAELVELREAVPLGHAKFLRYEEDMALFVCVDARANVHRIELDKAWIRAKGAAGMCEVMTEAVDIATTKLARVRRN